MGKTLYMLMGLKGAGKSTIGALLERRAAVRFLRVEPIWVEHLKSGRTDSTGWQVVEEEIDRLFLTEDRVVIESLGAGEEFEQFRRSLAAKYPIKKIRIVAEPALCLERVRTRDPANHIPISDARVEEINKVVAGVEHDWDLVIDNGGPASDAEVLRAFRSIL